MVYEQICEEIGQLGLSKVVDPKICLIIDNEVEIWSH